jgi:hypothetical protein
VGLWRFVLLFLAEDEMGLLLSSMCGGINFFRISLGVRRSIDVGESGETYPGCDFGDLARDSTVRVCQGVSILGGLLSLATLTKRRWRRRRGITSSSLFLTPVMFYSGVNGEVAKIYFGVFGRQCIVRLGGASSGFLV